MMYTRQAGFSAVELLITLFIAAIFLLAGYVLWNQVLSLGLDTERQARASNIAYEFLRRDWSQVDCTDEDVITDIDPETDVLSISGLQNPTARIVVSCPYKATATSDGTEPTTIMKISSAVEYDSLGKRVKVTHATYVN